VPARDLLLIPLDRTHPHAPVMVDGGWSTYADSRAAASALLADTPEADGLIWCSRELHDVPSRGRVARTGTGVCVLLVGRVRGRQGGVRRRDLSAVGPVVPFATVAGLERLDVIADELGVTVVRS
jgi:hypothetical protein